MEKETTSNVVNTGSAASSYSPTFKIVTIIAVILMMIAGYFAYKFFFPQPKVLTKDERKLMEYRQSIMWNNPIPLQKSFVIDVKNGVNDKYTKSDAYFITHRFFDNGGNIYEIYDYINANPGLAFMKEAEQIYPEEFAKIKDGTMPRTNTDSSLYAYLAYVQTLEKHGYTDIAALGTVANQYAKNAYYNSAQAKETDNEYALSVLTKHIERDTQKAVEYVNKSKSDIAAILEGRKTGADIPERDILVGLNQYAAAVRYLKALGVEVDTPKSSDEIFAFAREYLKQYVPELEWFTGLLDASTLVLLPESTEEQVRVALKPILDFDVQAKAPIYVIKMILNSKVDKPNQYGLMGLGLYSRRNAIALADKVPEFREWLLRSGWTEADLKY